MPYRRRSRRYSRRAVRRKYTWVRSGWGSNGTFGDTTCTVVDLLWPARQPPATIAQLDEPQVRAATDTSLLPTLALEDVMVERIHANIALSLTVGTTTSPRARLDTGITLDSNYLLSVQSDTGTTATYNAILPGVNVNAARISWMHWSPYYMWDPKLSVGEIGTGEVVDVIHIDCKSRRRIRDWGDQLLLVMDPAGFGDASTAAISGNSSVLLSHR